MGVANPDVGSINAVKTQCGTSLPKDLKKEYYIKIVIL